MQYITFVSTVLLSVVRMLDGPKFFGLFTWWQYLVGFAFLSLMLRGLLGIFARNNASSGADRRHVDRLRNRGGKPQ